MGDLIAVIANDAIFTGSLNGRVWHLDRIAVYLNRDRRCNGADDGLLNGAEPKPYQITEFATFGPFNHKENRMLSVETINLVAYLKGMLRNLL